MPLSQRAFSEVHYSMILSESQKKILCDKNHETGYPIFDNSIAAEDRMPGRQTSGDIRIAGSHDNRVVSSARRRKNG